ncbi:MAG: DedA family protein [Chloroflexota bacterium]
MSDVATALVAWLAVYTYPVAALTVLIGAIGLPLPSAVVVLAAGSITADGDLDPWSLYGLLLASAVTGDVASYSVGRWASHLVLGRWGARIGVTPGRLASVERRFERWGGLLVVITRCVLTGLAIPTNLVAGASTYPLLRFFLYSLMGEAIWVGYLVGLGWYFGPSWVSLLDYLDDAVMMLTALAIAIVLVLVLVRLLRPSSDNGDEIL